MGKKKSEFGVMLIGLVLVVGGSGFLLYQNPVIMEPLEVSNYDDKDETEYTDEVYVYNMVEGNDELELKFNDEEYKNIKYSVSVYYVNHTGISSEGLGGGGSSYVENYNSFSDSWSKDSGSYRSHKLDNQYAFALVDVSVDDESLADGVVEANLLSLLALISSSFGALIFLLAFILLLIRFINAVEE